MNRKRILSLWLVLLMLAMTACGKSQNAASAPIQESNANVQIDEAAMPQSTVSESSKADEAAAEDEGQSDIQEDGAEIQDNLEINEVSETDSQEAISNNLPVQGGYYYDVVNVVLYLEMYDELPPNYITKNEARALGWEGGSVEKYKEGAAIGGDHFGNREGLLPVADGRSYTECDIDTHGYSSRGSRRLIFSNDGLYFYTSDHYESFSEVTVTEDYEVLW